MAAEHSIHLKAENMAEKLEWMSKIRACIESASPRTESVRSKDSKDSGSSASVRPGSAPASSVSECAHRFLCFSALPLVTFSSVSCD